jgi:hypothetical protein
LADKVGQRSGAVTARAVTAPNPCPTKLPSSSSTSGYTFHSGLETIETNIDIIKDWNLFRIRNYSQQIKLIIVTQETEINSTHLYH